MMEQPFTIALVAGEASGDQLGAALIQELRLRHPDASFVGIGGENMRAAGMNTWWDSTELAVFGLFEVLAHFPRLYRMRTELKNRLLQLKPDVFIGIDAPDFNLGLEIKLKSRGIRTIHYVSPTVWAWRPGRVKKIGRAADRVLCLFPFEPDFYRDHGVDAVYVGHPMADQIEGRPSASDARHELGLSDSTSVLALLPGSRIGEVNRLAAPMLQAAARLQKERPGLQVVVALANEAVAVAFSEQQKNLGIHNIKLVEKQPRKVMAAADVVLCASGTATLETMLVNRPMVMTYKLSPATYGLAKVLNLIKLKFFALPNILAGEELIPELIQDEANGGAMAAAATLWLDSPEKAERLQARFDQIHLKLRCNASERAASAVEDLLPVRL